MDQTSDNTGGTTPATQHITKHLRIFGKVQGVYYRAWCKETAQDLNLTGWVRNRDDGSVEALATGSPDNINRLIDACHSGPPNAKVDVVQVITGENDHKTSFEIRETI